MKCDARIRPFPNGTEVACEREGAHGRHEGVLRDYAYSGSEIKMAWTEGDRRTFHGEWPGYCTATVRDCILPSGHHGGCAS